MQNRKESNSNAPGNIIQENMAHIDQASFLLRMLHSPIRQQIITTLLQKEGCAVNELCEIMNIKQSIMSQNLALLRNASLVIPRRVGREVHYSINSSYLNEVMKFVQNLSQTAQ
ncbi:MAG TPA: metalloregulator ArsR/SmtB family transcription factor [Chitinophagales bacterium]|nr:metalloregulator ArsR/SmtB family transcription factor [Chitinophagales bacterium]